MQKQEASISIPPLSDGRQIIGSAFLQKGITEESVDVMINSITRSTLRQYESSLKHWWEFSHLRNLNMFNAKSVEIISFLNNLFEKGASYSTLNTSRSVISLISLYDINKDGLIVGF